MWPTVPQETFHVPSGHQLQQNQTMGSLEAEPHTMLNVLMAGLAGWVVYIPYHQQGKKTCSGTSVSLGLQPLGPREKRGCSQQAVLGAFPTPSTLAPGPRCT